MGDLNDFHVKNWQRMHEAFAPPHDLKALTICVQEEVGELAGAVLGVTGEKARKAHLTKDDVLDAVADAMTYLSLVARSAGCEDLEELIGATFNMVSERAGSSLKTTLGQSDGAAPPTSCPLVSGLRPCMCEGLPRCPQCNYTKHDAAFEGDHDRCRGRIPEEPS